VGSSARTSAGKFLWVATRKENVETSLDDVHKDMLRSAHEVRIVRQEIRDLCKKFDIDQPRSSMMTLMGEDSYRNTEATRTSRPRVWTEPGGLLGSPPSPGLPPSLVSKVKDKRRRFSQRRYGEARRSRSYVSAASTLRKVDSELHKGSDPPDTVSYAAGTSRCGTAADEAAGGKQQLVASSEDEVTPPQDEVQQQPQQQPQQQQQQHQQLESEHQKREALKWRRTEIIDVLFRALERNGRIRRSGMYSLSLMCGYPGTKEAFRAEYKALCAKYNAEAKVGVGKMTFSWMLDDVDGNLYLTTEQLEGFMEVFVHQSRRKHEKGAA